MGALLSGQQEYLDVRARGATTFDLAARFPDQVFRRNLGESLFCEFDAVLTPEFWPALSEMARWHGDDHVEVLVLEPDCDSFYLPECRIYPAVSLPVDAGPDGYWAAIGYEPEGEALGSIAISAQVIAMTGASGRWGCWGERDPEIAVFQGFPDAATKNSWRERFGPFAEVAGALQTYLPLTFANRTVPDEYAETLTANYA